MLIASGVCATAVKTKLTDALVAAANPLADAFVAVTRQVVAAVTDSESPFEIKQFVPVAAYETAPKPDPPLVVSRTATFAGLLSTVFAILSVACGVKANAKVTAGLVAAVREPEAAFVAYTKQFAALVEVRESPFVMAQPVVGVR